MKRTKPKAETAKPAAEANGEKYTPTEFEAAALKSYKDATPRRGPRLKLTIDGAKPIKLTVDHPNQGFGQIALMRTLGTTNAEFYNGLLGHIINASVEKGGANQDGANFMLAVIKGIEPRDQIEAMLAAQMAAVHAASMTFARRLAQVENIPQQDSAERAFNKLTRTFAAQVAALKDYRSKGEQKMTVQHVHVAEGGRAIVGSINAASPGGGASEKTGDQPHAITHSPGVALSCDFEAERETVPSASGSRA